MVISESLIAQLVRLQEWVDADGKNTSITLFDYACFVGTPEIFLSFAELFSPDLVLYADCRFLKHRFDVENFNAWKNKGLALVEIQKMLNHVHIRQVIQGEDMSDELSVYIATVLKSMWEKSIPNSSVEIFGDNYDEVSVTFFESHFSEK